ncbi:MAG: PA0069 family radical SAM protein [Rhodospirillales bacterium]|nr:PA0069 family radical SAM protein [Rhodospirillales bacterium]
MEDSQSTLPQKGRGAVSNRSGRFEAFAGEAVDDGWNLIDEDLPPLRTHVTIETPRTIIVRNTSPDIPFDRSINPYKGCEHGCVYCFARPTHAYMWLSPGLDFESRLFAKPTAPALLERELSKPGYKPRTLHMGTNTDPYQPIEKTRRITRGVLKVLSAFNHPVSITTKSALVCRDLDILGPMAARGLVSVGISVTTLDRRLARALEPRAPTPGRRLDAIRTLSAAGVPTAVMAAPMIPVLNDAELETILERAAAAGASSAGYVLLRLPLEIKDLFTEWLAAHVPDQAAHVLSQMRDARSGAMYEQDFGTRMTGSGERAKLLAKRFDLACRRLGLKAVRGSAYQMDATQFKVPAAKLYPLAGDQLELF